MLSFTSIFKIPSSHHSLNFFHSNSNWSIFFSTASSKYNRAYIPLTSSSSNILGLCITPIFLSFIFTI